MKKLFFLSILFCFAFTTSETGNGYATTDRGGKLLFVNAIPTNAYTVVGKAGFANTKKNVQAVGADPTGIRKVASAIDDAIEKVQKGKQENFQAAVVYSPIKIELINFNTGTINENSACIVGSKGYSKKCGEKEIFFLSKPSVPYTEVKVIHVSNFTNLGQLKYGKDDIDNFLNKLYERACKEAKDGVDFDGITIDADHVVVSGFLEAKTLALIKYD